MSQRLGFKPTLREKLDEIDGRISTNEGDISDIQGDISDIQGDVSDIQGDVSNIQGDVSDAQGQIETLENGGFAGDSRWDDLRIEPVVRNAGLNIPAFEKWFDNGSGSKGVFLYSFTDENVNEKEIHFTVQFPHSWKGTAIHPHIHWVPFESQNDKKVKWGFEYNWVNIGGTFGNTNGETKDTNTAAETNLVAGKHYITAFTAITPSASQNGISSVLIGRIYRNSSDGTNDTYTNKVGLLYIDIHYEIDSLGSQQEYIKT